MTAPAAPFDAELVQAAGRLLQACRSRGLTLATAESCTGGLIAACLTEIPGSSDVVDRGFVTYSNPAKTELLAVPAGLIQARGAVSEEVARAMANGALAHSAADLALAVTGVAGPGGGTADKPVGLVHIAAARRAGPQSHRAFRFGPRGRSEIRMLTVAEALAMALGLAEQAPD
jgi:nicotinamide-nucleotide amidase